MKCFYCKTEMKEKKIKKGILFECPKCGQSEFDPIVEGKDE